MKDSFLQFLALTKRAGKLVEGYNKSQEYIKLGKVSLCIISKSISKNSFEKFERLCENYKVKMIFDYDKEILGSILGREDINVISVIDADMSKRLIEIYDNNQNNRG